MIVQIEKEIAEHPPRVSVPGVPHIFAHMGHSRTPSGCSVISFTSSILSEPISENYPHSEPETDHRGYEIEKDDIDDDDIDNDDGDNPGNDAAYEADDESGFEGKKKKKPKDKLKEFVEEKARFSNDNTEYIIVNSGDNLGGSAVTTEQIPRRPGILKNSTERLKNLEIKNSVGEVGISGNQGDKFNSSQNSKNMDLDPSSPRTNKSAGKSMQRESTVDGRAECSSDVANQMDDNNISDKDLDFETCEEESDFDAEFEKENQDTVKDLPQFIDSVHSFDLTEILSQHSAKTVENGEDVMSTHSSKTTHSSRTLEGSASRTLESTGLSGDRVMDVKNKENSVLVLKGKAKVDKENRTLSWVKEAQSLHFSDQVEQGRELEDTIGEVNGVPIGCLDAAA